MAQIHPAMRLKVKADTFFLSGSDGSVYFRNNEGSFRMEGNSIAQWVERLIPAFDGTSRLEELTDGLPDAYRERVFEIASVLYEHGFVRDVSQDLPHQLTDEIVKRHLSKVEFLDMFGGSGAARFQSYRQAKVLAVGAGPFFVSLVSSLLESGLAKIPMRITDEEQTNRERLTEIVKHHREAELLEVAATTWREAVQAYDWVLYVSQAADIEELLALQTACQEENKAFFPAVCLNEVGMAGPLVHPDGDGSWDSVWHRLHQTEVGKLQLFSSTAGALLANVAVFELFKTVTGVTSLQNTFFLLNLETLEGNWHWYLPHPLVTGLAEAKRVEDFAEREGTSDLNQLFSYFGWLTSAQAGIFHLWEEGNLVQLPLAQCRVQAVDPLSKGHAELLPDVICSSLTHEEARLQAGLAGIEAYVSRLVEHQTEGFVGVGAGRTVAEAICRGLQRWLANEFLKKQAVQPPTIRSVELRAIEDESCAYYVHCLTTIHGAPSIGLGQDVYGFPVVWVEMGGRWYGSVGLNVTLAVKYALLDALAQEQTQAQHVSQATSINPHLPHVVEDKDLETLLILAGEETEPSFILETALQVLNGQGKRLVVLDLALEPFLREVLAGVFGVRVREEESP